LRPPSDTRVPRAHNGLQPTAVVEDAWTLRLKEFKLKLPLLD